MVDINCLQEERKKLVSDIPATRSLIVGKKDELINTILDLLLKPKDWIPPTDNSFCLSVSEIVSLVEYAKEIIAMQPMLVSVRAPVKIFGDIHGQ